MHSVHSLSLLEPEYRAYQARWDRLESQGWKFSTPEHREGYTGMTIFRDDRSHTFYVEDGSAESVHRQLLRECESYVNPGWRDRLWNTIQRWIREH